MPSRLHVFISGYVQGVFYRFWTKEQAEKLGVSGWVRNLDDSRVEVLAEGPKEILIKFSELLKKGPPLARIEHIDLNWEKSTGEFSGFSIER